MPADAFNLDRLRMNAPVTAPGGVVSADTTFEFSQTGNIAEARYAGGRVTLGRLVGIVTDDTLEFRYAQVHDDGSLHGGHSKCTLERTDDAKVRIVESYEWADGGTGVNIIQEL